MKGIVTRRIADAERLNALAQIWNSLPREAADLADGLDGTNCHCWFEALRAAFPEATTACVLRADRGDRLIGLLPVMRKGAGLKGYRLCAPTELYGGRCGPLLADPNDSAALVAILGALAREPRRWTCLEITVPEGLPAATLRQACNQLGWHILEDELLPSASFPIPPAGDDLLGAMPARFRQNLRTALNRANRMGARLHTQFVEDHAQSKALLEAVLKIEFGSWKHSAGSAIADHPRQQAFYRELVPRALDEGRLVAMLIFLDGEAIAYNFGLLHDGVFCCLKHSHLQTHDALSPSNLLMVELLRELAQRGTTRFDWMGVVETHKLRWSSSIGTYRRKRMRIYPSHLMGWLHHAVSRLRLIRAAL